jgi:hypothetical protein
MTPTDSIQSEIKARSAQFVTIALAALLTGLSEKAIRRKIEEGKWLVGREVFKSPDGGVFVSIKGFEDWIGRGKQK